MKTDAEMIADIEATRAALLVAECGYCGATDFKHWELADHIYACKRITRRDMPQRALAAPVVGTSANPRRDGESYTDWLERSIPPKRVVCSMCGGNPKRTPWAAPCTACDGQGWYTP